MVRSIEMKSLRSTYGILEQDHTVLLRKRKSNGLSKPDLPLPLVRRIRLPTAPLRRSPTPSAANLHYPSPPEAMVSYPIAGNRYQNPRLPDPYSGQKWGVTDAPTMAQMIAVKEALGGMMDVRRIMFFQAFNVVELVVGDGRNYAQASLLGRVTGISTSYHHQQTLSEPIVPRQARRNPSPYARYACKHHNHDQYSNEPKRIQELDLGSAHPKARTTGKETIT
jgi:hypothetical protein